MEYVCKVGTPTGVVTERTFSATDERALRSDLEQQGYYLFSFRRRLAGLGVPGLAVRLRRIRTEALLIFSQELAALLKAGLPLLQSLDVMLERQKEPVFKRSLSTIRDKVKGGIALSEAFREEGDLYPPIFAASLVAGERSGSLETVLRRFTQYLRLNQSVKKKAIAAAIYPTVLFTLMTGLGFVLLVFVIPAFQDFYADLGADLPTITVTLITVGTWAKGHLHWIFLGLVGAVVAMVAWLRQPASGAVVDRLLIRLPSIGPLM